MAVISTTCLFCRCPQSKEYGGIRIKGRHICRACERRITVLDWDDPDYEYYKWGLKKIWY